MRNGRRVEGRSAIAGGGGQPNRTGKHGRLLRRSQRLREGRGEEGNYRGAVSACEAEGEWRDAVQRWRRRTATWARKTRPPTTQPSALARRTGTGEQLQRGGQRLRKREGREETLRKRWRRWTAMSTRQTRPRAMQPSALAGGHGEEVTDSGVVSACGTGGEWRAALHTLVEEGSQIEQANTAACRAAVSACEKGGERMWVTAGPSALAKNRGVVVGRLASAGGGGQQNGPGQTSSYNAAVSAGE